MTIELLDRINILFRELDLTSTAGLSIPQFSQFDCVDINDSNLEYLQSIGVEINGPHGTKNRVLLADRVGKIKLKINFNNTNNNVIILDNDTKLNGNFIIEGHNHVICIGGSADNIRNITQLVIRNSNNLFLLGSGGSIGQASFWIEGPHKAIIICDDPLFAWNIYVRNADSHGIIDLVTKELINSPRSVFIGPHVWIGQDTHILKGVVINAGSIIGASSLVTRNIPSNSIAAGVPAQVLKSNVTWTRQAKPDDEAISELMNRIYMNSDC